MGISSQQLAALSDHVRGLAARVHEKVAGPIGPACVRAFLKGEPDPGKQHLGPPEPGGLFPSMRWLLFGQPDNSPDDDEQS
jgi:hypothetical protein